MSADGDWLRPVVGGLVAAVAVFVLAVLATNAPEDRAGWRRIEPSPMHWTGIALGTGLTLVMGYVRLFVGSTRADAASQMTILTWLIAAFALCTIGVAWSMMAIRRRAIRWRGTRVVWRQGAGERAADLARLTAIGGTWLGHAVLRFADGTALRLDPYARGAQQLLERAHQQLEPDEAEDDAA